MHRLWFCPACSEERESVIEKFPEAMRPNLDGVDFKDPEKFLLFTRGIFEHPGDVFPRPASEAQSCLEVVWPQDPERQDRSFRGDVFIDGSCFKSVVPELSRSGLAYVVFGEDQEILCHGSAPLWPPLPQTPQAAEFCGLSVAGQLALPGSTGFSDCLNVCR